MFYLHFLCPSVSFLPFECALWLLRLLLVRCRKTIRIDFSPISELLCVDNMPIFVGRNFIIILFAMKTNEILAQLEAKHPGEKEFLQAVKEVLLSIEDVYNQHPEFEKYGIIERIVYAEVPPRVEYRLSAYGQTLAPVLAALKAWGDAHWQRAR